MPLTCIVTGSKFVKFNIDKIGRSFIIIFLSLSTLMLNCINNIGIWSLKLVDHVIYNWMSYDLLKQIAFALLCTFSKYM